MDENLLHGISEIPGGMKISSKKAASKGLVAQACEEVEKDECTAVFFPQ